MEHDVLPTRPEQAATCRTTAVMKFKRRIRAAAAPAVFEKRIGERICQRQKSETATAQSERIFRHGRKFQFLRLRRELAFFLGFFAGGDGLAQRTRMFAVKRAATRLRTANACTDCSPASSSTRPFAAAPNARPSSRRAQAPQKFCRTDRTQEKLTVVQNRKVKW